MNTITLHKSQLCTPTMIGVVDKQYPHYIGASIVCIDGSPRYKVLVFLERISTDLKLLYVKLLDMQEYRQLSYICKHVKDESELDTLITTSVEEQVRSLDMNIELYEVTVDDAELVQQLATDENYMCMLGVYRDDIMTHMASVSVKPNVNDAYIDGAYVEVTIYDLSYKVLTTQGTVMSVYSQEENIHATIKECIIFALTQLGEI